MATLPRALAPLRSRDYRLLASSMGLSLFAQGLWTVALVWQVVELGGGPGALSLATALQAAGMLASTLLGGALADRVPQRRILLGVALLQTVAVGTVALLSLAGALALGPLAAAALAGGIATGLYYPAYSALVPGVVPPGELLAANGLEGVVRPALAMAAGPAAGGLLVALFSPGAALLATALTSAAAAACVAALPTLPVRREGERPGLLADVREGVAYMVRTPWLLATLLFASLMVLLIMGPFEVLVPFAVRDRAGGGPAEHAWVLAAFGIGGAVGSAVVASLRLPRRYLTVMNLLWGAGCVPLVVFGATSQLWPMIAAAALLGAAFEAGTVIWGTLLQRRVPPALLGRVSSLDFFVSLAFMPLSMALAGPVSQSVGLTGTFLLAGLVPPVLAVLAVLAWRLPADELAHPLDVLPEDEGERVGEPA
ncbi:Predicted arabinose efflux permease, MFS family [Geodermatophilus telluris]|uniref:Predicted arabinose efflux permease, MFS family n=1 Tax=Geodermatophilus telluris TaxID=1190417 RepID=A0A1G6JN22_9ACTN|nr:MFS transporter [Geodermatophilus telluris]SDC20048.1 Predicted arabinose efflux permease, MFS family [Geodermatophilus telluris]